VCEEASVGPGTLHQRRHQPLHVKIENTIPYLLRGCTPKTYHENYQYPVKDEEVGLYLLPTKLQKKKFF